MILLMLVGHVSDHVVEDPLATADRERHLAVGGVYLTPLYLGELQRGKPELIVAKPLEYRLEEDERYGRKFWKERRHHTVLVVVESVQLEDRWILGDILIHSVIDFFSAADADLRRGALGNPDDWTTDEPEAA
jgi:hypothetical protein